jgi:membrane-bound lytic murein transglycosylase B
LPAIVKLITSSRLTIVAVLASALLSSSCAAAATKPVKKMTPAKSEAGSSEFAHFSQWKDVTEFIDQMVLRHGFNKSELDARFDQVRYIESAIQLMKPAPAGKPKNWKAYRARFLDNYRLEAGIAFWDRYADALTRAESQYGIPAEIIVGLLGVESVYGRNTGNFRVMDALTTLAFAYPDTPTRVARMEFFRSELESILLIARDSSTDPFSYTGSYAGAIGWPQFMPSSLRTYAVDFDGDGKINLMNSPVDAIGSVANYLALHGWKRGLPTVFPATLTATEGEIPQLSTFLGQGLKATYQLAELKTIATTASPEVPTDLAYGLVDLQNGTEATEYWIGTDNFFAITQYNRSYFYAMSVIDLGRLIASARQK